MRIHTCCVLTKFLLVYKAAGLKELGDLKTLHCFLMHFSRVVLREAKTRSMSAEEKLLLLQQWSPAMNHHVVATNIILFFVRRSYLTLRSLEQDPLAKHDWDLELVDKAIDDQEQALS